MRLSFQGVVMSLSLNANCTDFFNLEMGEIQGRRNFSKWKKALL